MWHLLVWIPTAALLALWSGLCWLVHRVVAHASTLNPGDWLGALDRWQIPAWLAAWLPMDAIGLLKGLLVDGVGWLEAAATHWPGLVGWLDPLLGLLWAAGALTLLLTGLIGSVAVAAIVRSGRPAALTAAAR